MEKKTSKFKFKSIIVGVICLIVAYILPQTGVDMSSFEPIIELILQVTGQETTGESTEITNIPTQDSWLQTTEQPDLGYPNITLADIPKYSGSPYVVINDNNPYFDGNIEPVG